MSRKAKAWFRVARGEWYATVSGKQVRLGITDPGDLAGAESIRIRLTEEAAAKADVAEGEPAAIVVRLVRQLVAALDRLPQLAQRDVLLSVLHGLLAQLDPQPPPRETG